MSSDFDFGEPLFKRERIDDELEMVNYEVPMQIEVPEDASDEVDPLALGNGPEPGETIQPFSISNDFARPIKSELETKTESLSDIEDTDSGLPKIDCVIPNFSLPSGQIKESVVIGSVDPLANPVNTGPSYDDENRKSFLPPDDSEMGDSLIHPKTGTIGGAYDAADRDSIMGISAEETGIHHSTMFQQAPEVHYRPTLETLSAQQSNAAIRQESIIVRKTGLRPEQSEARQSDQDQSAVCPWFSTSSADPSLLCLVLDPTGSPILEPMTVGRLLENPFSGGTWTTEQKNAIIKMSRPTPNIIDNLRNKSAKHFYNDFPWLCGCLSQRKFFCWPCLLFFYSPTYTDLLWSVMATSAQERRFRPVCLAHQGTHAHQAAEKALSKWLLNVQSSESEQREMQVRDTTAVKRVGENRKLLSLLVQLICYLKKENHYASHKDYAECFDYVLSNNLELQNALIDLQGSSTKGEAWEFVSKYAQQVEDAILKTMLTKKQEDLSNTRFVTLFMEDFSNVVDNSDVAIIAHYIDQDGEIKERIVGIEEIGPDRSANAIFLLVQRILFNYSLRLKLAGFTYSPTLIHPSDVTAFNERIERVCPAAKFFHYQGHNAMGMLFGALSHLNKTCKNFFHTINKLQEFFKKYLTKAFLHFDQLNSEAHESYDFEYGFITTLKRSYSAALETFGSILACPGEWDAAVSSEAPIFMSFLQDQNTRFLIVLIAQLNLALMDVTGALQWKIATAEWILFIRRAISNFITIKNLGLMDVFLVSLSPVLVRGQGLDRAPEVPSEYVSVFNEVIDTAISFLHQRFDTVDFGYVDLESVALRYYSRLRLSTDEVQRFRLQIQILAREPALQGKSLPDTIKYFFKYKLAFAVPEYATFLNFAMTIPSSNTSLKCPCVERLRSRRDRSPKHSSSKATWIWEKDLLTEISRNKKLWEAVIDALVAEKRLTCFAYPENAVGNPISQ